MAIDKGGERLLSMEMIMRPIVEPALLRTAARPLVTTRPPIGDFHEVRIMVLAMTAKTSAPTLHPHQQALLLR